MNSERRQNPRSRLKEIVYLQMEPDNGGIVLNLSETGLAFQTASPVERGAVVRFKFSLPSGKEIRAVSEVTWTDETRKTGGLRFTFLPEGARQQIRKWIDLPASPFTDTPATVSAASALPPDGPALARDSSHTFGPHAFTKSHPLDARELPRKRSAWAGAFAAGSLTGLLVTVLAAGIWVVHSSRARAIESLAQQSQSPADSPTPPTPPAVASDGSDASVSNEAPTAAPEPQKSVTKTSPVIDPRSGKTPRASSGADVSPPSNARAERPSGATNHRRRLSSARGKGRLAARKSIRAYSAARKMTADRNCRPLSDTWIPQTAHGTASPPPCCGRPSARATPQRR